MHEPSVVHPYHHPSDNEDHNDQNIALYFTVAVSVVLAIVTVLTIVGNVFVIAAIILERNLRTTGNYLVLSLAVADLMVACLVMPFGAFSEIAQQWTLGTFLCDIYTSADVLCCTASILHLLAIALDRYWAVTYVDYIHKRTSQRICVMIFTVWTVAAIVSIAPLFGWKDPDFNRRVELEKRCLISQDIGYQVFATISTFYGPLIFILLLYWKIFQVARKRIRHKPGKTIMPAMETNTKIIVDLQSKQRSSCAEMDCTDQHSATNISKEKNMLENRGQLVNSKPTNDQPSTITAMLPVRHNAGSLNGSTTPNSNQNLSRTNVSMNRSPGFSTQTLLSVNRNRTVSTQVEQTKGSDQQTIGLDPNNRIEQNSSPKCMPSSGGDRGETGTQHLHPSHHFDGGSNQFGRNYSEHRSNSAHNTAIAVVDNGQCIVADERRRMPSPSSSSSTSSAELVPLSLSSLANVAEAAFSSSTGTTGQRQTQPLVGTLSTNSAQSCSNDARSPLLYTVDCDYNRVDKPGENQLEHLGRKASQHQSTSALSSSSSQKHVNLHNQNHHHHSNAHLYHQPNSVNQSKLKSIKESIESKRERKAAKILAIITGIFVICWLPFFVIALLMPLCKVCEPSKHVFSIFQWLGYLNSLLNPIIYTIFSLQEDKTISEVVTMRTTAMATTKETGPIFEPTRKNN